MERKKEFLVLSEALSSKESVARVNDVCRSILMERIDTIQCFDKEVLRLVKKIVAGFTPRIDVNVEKYQVVEKPQSQRTKLIACGVMGLIGLCTVASDSTIVRFLGGVALGVSGFASGMYLNQSQEKVTEKVRYQIQQTVDDLVIELDETFDSLKRLLIHNQLESQYSPILRWVQNLWVESDNETQNDIDKILRKMNYEFVEYSPDLSEYFDSNKTADADKLTTTRPALRNKNTGCIVERGHVIVPV